jgi:hypothetical protein
VIEQGSKTEARGTRQRVAPAFEAVGRFVRGDRFGPFCIGAIGLGVLVRFVAGLVLIGNHPQTNEYGVIASNWVSGRGYSFFAVHGSHVVAGTSGRALPSSFMGPGYTSVVAAARWLSSDAVASGRILGGLQIVFSLVLLVFAYIAGRQLGGRRGGLCAAALCAVYPQLALLPSLGSAANFYLPALLLVAIGSVQLRRGHVALGALVVLTGTLWLWTARSEAPLFAIVAVLAACRKTPSAKRLLAAGGVAVACSAVIIAAGWILPRSEALGGPIASVTSTGGFNFWLGNAQGASGSQKLPPPDSAALTRELKALPAKQDYERERDADLLNDAEANIQAHPVPWAVTEIKKLGMALTFDPYDGRLQVALVALSTLALSAIAFLVLVVWRGFRRIRDGGWVYLGLALTQVVLSTVFFALNRYKLGVDLPLLILVGGALGALNADEPTAPVIWKAPPPLIPF